MTTQEAPTIIEGSWAVAAPVLLVLVVGMIFLSAPIGGSNKGREKRGHSDDCLCCD